MTTRLATPADAAAVARMLHDFNAEFGDPTPGPAVLEERLKDHLQRDDVVAVLTSEDPPAGLALLFLRPTAWDDTATLDELYVRPERRGQGLGAALLERAFAVARERGCAWFELDTNESDVGARRFYERHGLSNGDDRALYYSRRL